MKNLSQLQRETNRELEFVKLGYNYAIQDIYEKIIELTNLKDEKSTIDPMTKLIMERRISQAFMQINEIYEERTLLIYTKYL
jgi:hypothetical protein